MNDALLSWLAKPSGYTAEQGSILHMLAGVESTALSPERNVTLLTADEQSAEKWRKLGWQVCLAADESAASLSAASQALKEKTAYVDAGLALLMAERPQALLEKARALCIALGAPLALKIPNAGSERMLLELFSGEPASVAATCHHMPARNLFTHESLSTVMCAGGFALKSEEAVSLKHPADSNSLLAEGTSIHKTLSYYHQLCDPYHLADIFIQVYEPAAKKAEAAEETEAERPFLSIVMRTMGKRVAELQEALLCLGAQEDTSFELLLIGHNMEQADAANVARLLEEQPEDMRRRVRMLSLNQGNRTAPLNYGFQLAAGEYIAALDDDDLISADWVERFHKAAKLNPGAMLHAYSVAQKWSRREVMGRVNLRAEEAPDSVFCTDFDWFNQFQVNRCPFMSMAFPRDAVRRFGFAFDDALNTVEDWDFAMHVAMLVGVADIPCVTSWYRQWENAENSQTLYGKAEWLNNLYYVQDKLRKIPFFMPAGALIPAADTAINATEIYGWCQDCRAFSPKLRFSATKEEQRFGDKTVTFDNLEKHHLSGKLRWDPSGMAWYTMDSLCITVKMVQGAEKTYGFRNVKTNGVKTRRGIILITEDPQLWFDLPKGTVEKVSIQYSVASGFTVSQMAREALPILWASANNVFRHFSRKAARKLYALQHREKPYR